MSTGKVFFSGSNSHNFTKRRKIMKGVDPNRKPEIKQWNPVVADNTSVADRTNFTSLVLYPCVSYVPATRPFMTSWKFYYLNMPVLGDHSCERNGNAIFLKALRLKGWITVYNKLDRSFRWRLKLYRFKGMAPVAADNSVKAQCDNYLQLFKATQKYNSGQTVRDDMNFCRHNYYKCFKDLPKKYDYSVKVIASGFISPSNGLYTQGSMTHFGDALWASTMKVISHSDEVFGCLPLDVKVKVNDRVNWTNDADGNPSQDVFYALALEEDFGVGVVADGPTTSGGDLNPVVFGYSQDRLECPVFFNFFIRGYFTDY